MTLEGSNFVNPDVGFTPSVKLDNVLVGRYLSLEDSVFVENVISDIQHFLNQEVFRKSVLIFPPVNNYRRFLIHKISEEITSEELSTFSIGQGFSRRTVVCVKSLIRKQSTVNQTHEQLTKREGGTSDKMVVDRQPLSSENSSPEHNSENDSSKRVRSAPAIYRPPAARKLEALQMKHNVDAAPIQAKAAPSKPDKTRSGTRQRRPDLQVYVPRAKRASMMDRNISESPTEQKDVAAIQNQLLCGMKKNIPVLPTSQKTSNIGFNKICCISTSLKCDGENRLICKKSDDCRVGKEKIIDTFKENQTSCILSVQDGVQNTVPSSRNVSENISNKYGSEVVNVNESNTTMSGSAGDKDDHNLSSDAFPNLNIKASSDWGKARNDVEEAVCNDPVNSLNLLCANKSKELMDILGSKKDLINEIAIHDNLDLLANETTRSDKSVYKNDEVSDEKQANALNEQTLRMGSIPEVLVISDPPVPNNSVSTCHVPKTEENSSNINASKSKSRTKLNCVKTDGKNKPNNKSNPATPLDTTSTSVASLNSDECTWDMLFDDNGDCLHPKIMEELTSSVGNVAIKKPQSDYNRFLSKHDINLPGGDDEYSHVVEIYDFPPEFKTQDLLTVFAAFKNGGFEIKWVDDTHALGVFCSSRVAAEVLAYEHPLVKTRPLSEATPESRLKARRSAEFLQPHRTRPETCVALARRLVTGALGMKISTSREEREAERRLLKEAREKRRLAAKQQQDAWEGTIR